MRHSLLCFLMGFILTSCHSVRLENNPSEKEKAIRLTQTFTEHLASQQRKAALKLTKTPFWLGGKRVSNAAELNDLLGQNEGQDSFDIQFSNPQFFTLKELAFFLPHLNQAIEKLNLTPQNTFAVVLQTRSHGGNLQKDLFFLVQKQTGFWRIVGIEER